jgi:putative transposase
VRGLGVDLRGLVDRGLDGISIRRQCELLGLNRSNLYYESAAQTERQRTLLHRVDEIYTRCPFYGSRRIREELRKEGYEVNRKLVQSLMKDLGLVAIYPGPNLSKARHEHKKYPYLLRGVVIERPNQVWSADVTYIRMRQGFLYLVAVIDWFSRYVLSWNLSNCLDADFCVAALEDALSRYGNPDIFNSDQGVQFTSEAHVGVLLREGIAISMDGRGRALDNIFIERLWRSLKYEEVYLKDYVDGREARTELGNYLGFYNNERPHQSLNYVPPAAVYFGGCA